MVKEGSDKEYERASATEIPENNLRHNFRLGDMTWVKHSGSSWWPAQVIDEACVGSKPKKKAKQDCLVRLYGTCQYIYVDAWKSNLEFKMMLKQESKSATEVFYEVLEKDLSLVNSSSGYDEEDGNSEGTQTKVTTEKTSTVQKGKRKRGRKLSSSHDTAQITDKDSCDHSAKSLRGKRQKQVAHAFDEEGSKIGASTVRREGLRQSARVNAKEHLAAAEDGTVSLTATGASEDATEISMVDETSAPHTEIKALVRDILFKEIIDREHDAEMARVDEVIDGICSTAVDSITGDATAFIQAGLGIKQNGIGVEGESSRKGKPDDATNNTMQVTSAETMSHSTTNINSKNDNNADPSKEATDTTLSRGAAMKERGQLSPRQIRQIRIMQSLGLIAPSGSPFGKIRMVAGSHQ